MCGVRRPSLRLQSPEPSPSSSHDHELSAGPSTWTPLQIDQERLGLHEIPGAGRREDSPILLRQIGFHVKEEALALLHLVFQLLCSLRGLRWERGSASESMAGVSQCRWGSPSPAGTLVGTLRDRERNRAQGVEE